MILTLIALFVTLIGVACIVISNRKQYAGEGWLTTGVFLTVIAGLCLLICTIAISIKEIEVQKYIVRIEAVRETFGRARADKSMYPVENAAIQIKVAEKNEWIAEAKFWAQHPLTNWFWSKRILEIEPIR